MSGKVRGTWSDLGALTTSGTVAATIFSCLPFATGLVGASVAAFGARFAPFRSYLIALSLAMLGIALVFKPAALMSLAGAAVAAASCSSNGARTCHRDDGPGTAKGPYLTRSDVQAKSDGSIQSKAVNART